MELWLKSCSEDQFGNGAVHGHSDIGWSSPARMGSADVRFQRSWPKSVPNIPRRVPCKRRRTKFWLRSTGTKSQPKVLSRFSSSPTSISCRGSSKKGGRQRIVSTQSLIGPMWVRASATSGCGTFAPWMRSGFSIPRLSRIRPCSASRPACPLSSVMRSDSASSRSIQSAKRSGGTPVDVRGSRVYAGGCALDAGAAAGTVADGGRCRGVRGFA